MWASCARRQRQTTMDQQALLASLGQLNASQLHSIAPMNAHRPPGMSSALPSAPCFNVPGLTLQGFNGMPACSPHQQGAPLLQDPVTSFQTLLNAANAAAHPAASQVWQFLCGCCLPARMCVFRVLINRSALDVLSRHIFLHNQVRTRRCRALFAVQAISKVV